MKINVTIPDEVYEVYIHKYGVAKMREKMTSAIVAFKDVDDKDRYIFLAGDDRRAVEAIFETTIGDGKQLAKLCQRLRNVGLGDVQIPFQSDELERLKMQAGFHGKSLDNFISDLAQEIKLQILDLY